MSLCLDNHGRAEDDRSCLLPWLGRSRQGDSKRRLVCYNGSFWRGSCVQTFSTQYDRGPDSAQHHLNSGHLFEPIYCQQKYESMKFGLLVRNGIPLIALPKALRKQYVVTVCR